jgi:hypothetical protein
LSFLFGLAAAAAASLFVNDAVLLHLMRAVIGSNVLKQLGPEMRHSPILTPFAYQLAMLLFVCLRACLHVQFCIRIGEQFCLRFPAEGGLQFNFPPIFPDMC